MNFPVNLALSDKAKNHLDDNLVFVFSDSSADVIESYSFVCTADCDQFQSLYLQKNISFQGAISRVWGQL